MMRNADFTVPFKMATRLGDSARAVSLTLPFSVLEMSGTLTASSAHNSADPGVRVCEGEGAASFPLGISSPTVSAVAQQPGAHSWGVYKTAAKCPCPWQADRRQTEGAQTG